MTMVPIPPALEALKHALQQQRPPSPLWLAAMAQWRLACGDGKGAARWRRWSLQAPAPEALREPVRELLLLTGDVAGADTLTITESWESVEVALAVGSLEQAQRLQNHLITSAAPLSNRLRLTLVCQWRERQHPQPALTLLMGLPHIEHSPPHCNLAAALMERCQLPWLAGLWWERSLHIQPDQLVALSRCASNALAQGRARRARHWAQRLLDLDPHHPAGSKVLKHAQGQIESETRY